MTRTTLQQQALPSTRGHDADADAIVSLAHVRVSGRWYAISATVDTMTERLAELQAYCGDGDGADPR